MATPEAEEAAARVIERLLVDPAFRADFRRDPETACREAGFDNLAAEMSYGAGKAMYTLDIRESRSSLAGVMMAAAIEGMAVFEFSEHIVPGVLGAPASVRNVLSQVNLPRVDGPNVKFPDVNLPDVRGKLAQGGPAPPAATPASSDPASTLDAGAAPAGAPAAPGTAPAPPGAAPAAAVPPATAPAPPGATSGAGPAAGGFEVADGGAATPSSPAAADAPAGGEKPAASDGFSVDGEEGGGGKPAPKSGFAVEGEEAGGGKPAPKSGFSVEGEDSAGATPGPRSGFAVEGEDSGAKPGPKEGFSVEGDGSTPAGESAPKQGFSAVEDTSGDPASSREPPSGAVAAAAEPQASAAAPEPQAARAPIDSGQFGADGSGGKPTAEALALLQNKNIVLDDVGVADIKAGKIDPRVVAVLTKLSEEHKITVSCMCTDHPSFGNAGSPSNHRQGRGVDIARVDGEIVNAGSPLAREVATELMSFDEKIKPNEVGTPWVINSPGYFTDSNHQDHLHVGFKQAIDPSWKPPDQLAAAATVHSAAPAAAAGAAAPSVAVRRDTVSFRAVSAPGGAGQASQTLTFGAVAAAAPGSPEASAANTADPAAASAAAAAAPAPAAPGTPEAPAAPPSGAPPAATSGAIGEAAAERLAKEGVTGTAGGKAMAALAEAFKYKGTPYLWGGSKPDTGFDCSGLVQWAYAQQGIQTGRTTYNQIDAPVGKMVGRDDLKPGDAVFFKKGSDVHHVGISMGGDKFLHAPHTGDVVKVSSLDEPYYAAQFAGGRRFDDSAVGGAGAAQAPGAAATPAPAAVEAAKAAVDRDAAAVRQPNSMIFKALSKQEASFNSTVQFMAAVQPAGAEQPAAAAAASVPGAPPEAGAAAAAAAPVGGSLDYPGNTASKQELARWLAAHAEKRGLPPELPVMAALVESNMFNNPGGDADSVGYFQMRASIWNKGPYLGYYENPNLQAKWFLDTALAVKSQRGTGFGKDPSTWGNWIADVERPAAQYRGRYQTRLEEARRLLGR